MARKGIYPESVTPGIPRLGQKPEGWVETTFGDVLQVVKRPVQMDNAQEYQLVLAKRNRGGIVARGTLLGKDILTKTQFFVRAGDFLISKRQIIHGACGVVPAELDGAIVSNEYITLRTRQGLLLDYLQYFCHTVFFQQTCFQSSVGVDVEKMIFDVNAWLRYRVHLPPLPEQRKIVQILGAWDEAIALTERLIEAKRRRKKGLMQQLLTGKRRFREFEGQEVRLRELLDIQYGKSSNGIRSESGQYAIYGTGGIVGRTNECLCDQPAIIIGRKGTLDQPQLAEEPFWAIDTTFYAIPRVGVDTLWIYYVLCNLPLERYNEASGVPSLSRETLYGIRVSLPCLNEQHRIGIVLRTCDEEIDLFNRKLALLREQKKGLMQQLLTGRIRVREITTV